jgi:hypothetical protein
VIIQALEQKQTIGVVENGKFGKIKNFPYI